MKTAPLILIVLLALHIASCSSSTEQKDILTRLLEAKMAGRDFKEGPGNDTTIRFDGPEELQLTGWYQLINNHLVITIYEGDVMENWYSLALYAPDGANQWKALFKGELVPGKLEKIIDLNGDQVPEFIVDEYNGNSAGFNSVQALYAKLTDYERIGELSKRWFGGSAYNGGLAEYSFKTESDFTKIIVHTEQTDIGADGTTVQTKGLYAFRWRPPELIRLEGEGDIFSFDVDLTEANSEWDSLYSEGRKEGLLTIAYEERSDVRLLTDVLYFEGSISGLKFRNRDNSAGDYYEKNHLEYNSGSARRARFTEAELYEPAVFFYVKNGKKHWVATQMERKGNDGLFHEVLIADPVDAHPDPNDKNFYFSAEAAASEHMEFIRTNASRFTPGRQYTLVTTQAGTSTTYKVDSLLWAKEFSNK